MAVFALSSAFVSQSLDSLECRRGAHHLCINPRFTARGPVALADQPSIGAVSGAVRQRSFQTLTPRSASDGAWCRHRRDDQSAARCGQVTRPMSRHCRIERRLCRDDRSPPVSSLCRSSLGRGRRRLHWHLCPPQRAANGRFGRVGDGSAGGSSSAQMALRRTEQNSASPAVLCTACCAVSRDVNRYAGNLPCYLGGGGAMLVESTRNSQSDPWCTNTTA
jgi:hypothetical protein